MAGNQSTVQHNPVYKREHNWLPGQVPKFTEVQQGVLWDPHIKSSPIKFNQYILYILHVTGFDTLSENDKK